MPAEFCEREVCVLPSDFKFGPFRIRASSACNAGLLRVLGRPAASVAPGTCHRFHACQKTGDAVAHTGQQSCHFVNNGLYGLPAVCGVRGRGAECDGRLIGQSALAAEILEVLVEACLCKLEAEVIGRLLFEVMRLVYDQHVEVRDERTADCGVG